MTNAKRVAIYTRVSTDGQSGRKPTSGAASCGRARWMEVVQSTATTGSAAPRPRQRQPSTACSRAHTARVRHDRCWSVDRLGRSLQHLVAFPRRSPSGRCRSLPTPAALNTSTPAGKAMFQMCGVFAEFERSMIVERVNAASGGPKQQARSWAPKDRRRPSRQNPSGLGEGG